MLFGRHSPLGEFVLDTNMLLGFKSSTSSNVKTYTSSQSTCQTGPASGAQGGPSQSSLAISELLWTTNCICTPKKEDFQLRTTHWRVYRLAHRDCQNKGKQCLCCCFCLLLLMQHRNHQFSTFGDSLYWNWSPLQTILCLVMFVAPNVGCSLPSWFFWAMP